MLDSLITDPNIVYLVLLLGIWMAVAAIYTPGTGLLETIAMGVLIGAILFLRTMPTNWLALLALVVGALGFLVLPLLRHKLATLAIAGLILQAIGGIFLFDGKPVSWLVIAVTIVIQFLYHQYVLAPMLKNRNGSEVPGDDETLIGSRGRVLKALDPIGTVQAGGETWTATSNRSLKSGVEVVVIERNGLQLYVEAMKHKRSPELNEEEEDHS